MIHAYLTFDGNTEEALTFYQSVLGGELKNLQRFGDTPHSEQLSDEDNKKIMHVTLEGPNGIFLMANDHMDFTGQSFTPGNNFSLTLHTASEEEARSLFNALSEDGTVLLPLDKVFWGAYFGMLTDKFGIKWMVNFQDKT